MNTLTTQPRKDFIRLIHISIWQRLTDHPYNRGFSTTSFEGGEMRVRRFQPAQLVWQRCRTRARLSQLAFACARTYLDKLIGLFKSDRNGDASVCATSNLALAGRLFRGASLYKNMRSWGWVYRGLPGLVIYPKGLARSSILSRGCLAFVLCKHCSCLRSTRRRVSSR
ncbi:hypothetical protein BP00DRAFT_169268 [Aspergillus indologenus CBS 114.80]|uniref:Uncharacterized protein n=1 Tax=Aspergillus indologenus CBS 114.80 TaxID=1450541 RepID=A0A2V5I8W5_9EURO|nr:hypothetical protein BP00DRAFT_169268 [Aspergillus indologenus CBS 114.80]